MARARLAGLDPKRLRRVLALFFLALALPSALLVQQAYSRLKWEAYHGAQVQAEELAARIDGQIGRLVAGEEARSFADYAFLVVAGDPAANYLQRSPLAEYPVRSPIPGLLGWFQVDSEGRLSTPLLPAAGADPAAFGVLPPELTARRALQTRLAGILAENRLVQAGPSAAGRVVASLPSAAPGGGLPSFSAHREREDRAPSPREAAVASAEVPAQAAFDLLKEAAPALRAKSAPLRDEMPVQNLAPAPPLQLQAKRPPLDRRQARREISALPEPAAQDAAPAPARAGLRIRTFESELDPFELALLDSGHFVLYRKVWRDGQRYIQGALIDQQPFLRGLVEGPYRQTALAGASDLAVAQHGTVLAAYAGNAGRGYPVGADELRGSLLYRTRLSAPASDLELVFSVLRLPPAPGEALLAWVAAALLLVLCGGFYLMYRLGVRQLELVRQQQDFVSAVSHELKTPLTSIRMFSEMLRAGWAPEEKRQGYYEYIFSESERLSRLIANVLQLARLTRNELQVHWQTATLGELLGDARPRLAAQAAHAGFALTLHCDQAAAGSVLRVDPDYFAQILTNLVDNALKFSAKAERREVELGGQRLRDGSVQVSVRDYGPGVPRDQMKKIFRLFYRPGNELTRETVGTGIGLALVRQLAQGMGARVDVVNRQPGAQFILVFPLATQ